MPVRGIISFTRLTGYLKCHSLWLCLQWLLFSTRTIAQFNSENNIIIIKVYLGFPNDVFHRNFGRLKCLGINLSLHYYVIPLTNSFTLFLFLTIACFIFQSDYILQIYCFVILCRIFVLCYLKWKISYCFLEEKLRPFSLKHLLLWHIFIVLYEMRNTTLSGRFCVFTVASKYNGNLVFIL